MFKAATLESIQNAPYFDVLSSVCDCDIECVNIWTQELPETGYLHTTLACGLRVFGSTPLNCLGH
jgi:hypothetical protein